MTPRKKDAEPLARERIVAAAMKIIDAEGLDALSMRRLGAELGVNPMAAYHYVPNKAALYDLVLEAVMAGVDTTTIDPAAAPRRPAQAGGARLPRGDPRASARHPRARDALAADGGGAAAGRADARHPLRRRPDAGRGDGRGGLHRAVRPRRGGGLLPPRVRRRGRRAARVRGAGPGGVPQHDPHDHRGALPRPRRRVRVRPGRRRPRAAHRPARPAGGRGRDARARSRPATTACSGSARASRTSATSSTSSPCRGWC